MSKFYLSMAVIDTAIFEKTVIKQIMRELWDQEEELHFPIDFDYKLNNKSICFTFKRNVKYNVIDNDALIDLDMMMISGYPFSAFDARSGEAVLWPVYPFYNNYYGGMKAFKKLFKREAEEQLGHKLKRVVIKRDDQVLTMKVTW